MVQVSVEDIRKLREITGAGILDCRTALQEADGDAGKAQALLREKGLASAAKKASRSAAEGVVESYIHSGSRIGALLELNCETDFVARTDEFRALAHDLAILVGDTEPAPLVVDVDGQVQAFLGQALGSDSKRTVQDSLNDAIAKMGENIQVRRFIRYALEQGVVESYIHSGSRIGALLELNCETDFVARTDEFRALAHDLAMQVAAMDPDRVTSEDEGEGASLMEQSFIKDPSKSIQDLVNDAIAKMGENIQVRRFIRYALAEE